MTTDTATVATELVEVDVSCRRCGYNLRGLPAIGRCPECHWPVERSLRGDQFSASDPSWVKTLADGALLIQIAAVPLLVSGILMGLWRTPRWWAWTGLALSALLAAMGVWKMTTRDPSAVDQRERGLTRRLIRAGLIAVVIMQSGMFLTRTAAWPARFAFVAATIAVGVACIAAFFKHLQHLARQLLDEKLARESVIVMWGSAISYAGLTALTLAAVAPGSLPRPWGMVFSASCTFVAATFVFWLWSVTLIGKFRVRLREAAIAAERVSSNDEPFANQPGVSQVGD